MKLDILAFGAHPDDVELGAGGTLAKHVDLGYKVGIIDLTKGEMGTRGTPEIRLKESDHAAKILGCDLRKNLGLRDGFITNNEESQLEVIRAIRKYQPDIVLCNAPSDRHPDHGNAATLVKESVFKAGLKKLTTIEGTTEQENWRPKRLYHYIQYHTLEPDFVVDISDHFEAKMASIKAHESQFFNPNSNEPETVIASKDFFDSLESRAVEYGRIIYTKFGEGFISTEMKKVNDLKSFL